MSLVVAVRSDLDVVMACDGRVLSHDLSVMSDDAPKTIALNGDVCLGLAGSTDSLRHVLASLGISCRGSHPVDLLLSCQEARCPVDLSYEDARSELTGFLRWMVRRVAPRDRIATVPSVILGGRSGGFPALAGWRFPTWRIVESPQLGQQSLSVGQVPPPGSPAGATFRALLSEGEP
ncbi:MAG: hypothetical protein AB7V19_07925, partial [Candidatus Bipolaricaulia bacterium]